MWSGKSTKAYAKLNFNTQTLKPEKLTEMVLVTSN